MTINSLNENTLRKIFLLCSAAIFIGSLLRLYTSMTTPLADLDSEFFTSSGEEQVEQMEKIDYRMLADWHLFGEVLAPVDDAIAAPELIEAPETRLSLRLLGTFYNADASQSLAIIDADNAEQKYYRIGDKLPGNVQLSQIGKDRVVLIRAGKHESLKMLAADAVTNSYEYLPAELTQVEDR